MTIDAINYSRNRELYNNVFKLINLKEKELFKSGSKTEHREDMMSDTYGRAQLLKQQQRQLKTIEREEITGRRIANEDGTISYQPTYNETTSWGDKT
ncbi:4823_t:CDS:2 [Scutellospora calospora]|uniref:4823_t:CDS:1 n=1 Tax=Scutellospora calospora TaxID=85575 RepID=A0ACA9MA37_9GLOM|nr:4823_t:CDS:2 [Scutellospora calospora]